MSIAFGSMSVPVVQGCYFNQQPGTPRHAIWKEGGGGGDGG